MNEFFAFWFSLFVLVMISHIIITFFHEANHKRKLKKNGILCEVKWNFKGIIKSVGTCSMAKCFFDRNKFSRLKNNSKKEILLAGIYSDLVFTFIFVILTVFGWLYFKRTFILYYFEFMSLTLILKILLNFYGKESDGKKLRIMTKNIKNKPEFKQIKSELEKNKK